MGTKKLIKAPKVIVEEMLEGIVAVHPRHLRPLPDSPRSVVAVEGPRKGKVGLMVGGGSGHAPGFVGRGLADAAAVDDVFASPPPDPIVACAKAVDGGAGVLFVDGNSAGDVTDFDMASEMAGLEGIDKTMLDAWIPAAVTILRAIAAARSVADGQGAGDDA